MDRFQEMKVFVAVAGQGSFSSSSRRMGMTPSAVNRIVTRLEERLGVHLFQRSSKGLGLTDQGRHYARECQRLLSELEQAERQIVDFEASGGATFRIASSVALGLRIVSPVLPEFCAAHPGVRVELITSNDIIDLVESNVDLAVRAAHLKSSTLIARKLMDDHRVLAASPRYLEEHGIPETPEDLQHHSCLNLAIGDAPHNWLFETGGKLRSISHGGAVSSNSSDVLLRAACDGLGIVRLSMFMLAPKLRSKELVAVLPNHVAQAGTGIYAVYVRRRQPSRLIRHFIDLALKNVKAHQGIFDDL